MSTEEIVGRLKLGEEKAFREFVDHYQQQVVNICFGFLNNVEDAQDVAQEVFIEVFRSIHGFRRQSKLSTWLYRIAVNRSLNFLRNNRKHKRFSSSEINFHTKSVGPEYNDPTTNNTPEQDMESRQRSIILHQAIDALPENQRVAFILNKYDDMNQNQVAEVLGISVSAVESLIHRAKKNLQKKLYRCYKKKCF